MIARGVLLLAGLIVLAVEWATGLIAEAFASLLRLLEQEEIQRTLAAAAAVPAAAVLFVWMYLRQIKAAARTRSRYRELARALNARYGSIRRGG